jgi:hypothetical protein
MKNMETRIFSLEIRENNKLTRAFQIIFGILCIGIACFWLVYNFRAVKSDNTLWITVAFLFGFGGYMVYSGLGLAARFIEFGNEGIRLKNNSVMPPTLMETTNIEKIEIYPLKAQFFLKSSKMILLRFGVTDTEKLELIKDEIIKFSGDNNIKLDLKNEVIL